MLLLFALGAPLSTNPAFLKKPQDIYI